MGKIGGSVIINLGSLVVTKWGRRYYKLGQLLKIRANFITNWSNYYKLGHNSINPGNLDFTYAKSTFEGK